jgi:hypothetical protein
MRWRMILAEGDYRLFTATKEMIRAAIFSIGYDFLSVVKIVRIMRLLGRVAPQQPHYSHLSSTLKKPCSIGRLPNGKMKCCDRMDI